MSAHSAKAAAQLEAAHAHLPWIRVGGYAFAALAVLKSIRAAVALEKSELGAVSGGIELVTVLVAVATAVAVLRRGDARWLAVGLAVYLLNVVYAAVLDPKSIVEGFFLSAGVLGLGGYALHHYFGLRQNLRQLHAAGFSESETAPLRRLRPLGSPQHDRTAP